jgi:two-component system sensor histidine kinase HydH
VASGDPLCLASATAGAFFLFSILYLAISGSFAAEASGTVEELASAEWRKGVGFMAFTALLLFAGQWVLLARLRAAHEETLAQRDKLLDLERQALAGVFASSTAHDLNNLLMAFSAAGMELEDLEEALRDGGNAEGAARLREQARQLEGATSEMAALSRRLARVGARAMPTEQAEEDVAEATRDAVRLAGRHRSLRECQLELDCPAALRHHLNGGLYRQALLNLVLNAGEAAGPGGRVRVTLRARGKGFFLAVEDDGPGLPADRREELFLPFVTTKPSGTGLGLVSVKALAEEHGGKVHTGTSRLGGARIVVAIA